jgi:DHA2 family multidrug resistance protein
MKVDLHRKWLVTLTVMLSTVMASLDGSIVNVAMPVMRGSLGASTSEITWIATAYMLANVVIMPAIAFLGSRFGRCRYFFWSVVLFGMGSALCGLAWDMPTMIFSRVLQGIGGGALIPVSQAILRETFPAEEQGKAMGIYGMGVVLGPALGPTLGGWLTDHFSWPWIFYINVPFVLLNLFLIPVFLQDPPYLERTRGKIDAFGLALMAVGLSCLQIMLEKGQENDWFQSSFILKLALVSVFALALFVWWELKIDRPAVRLRVLRNVPLATGTTLGAFFGMGLFGCLFLLPLFIQQVRGYSAMDAGLAMLPRSLAMAVSMPFAGRIYNRAGPRKMITSGLIMAAFSFFLLGRLAPQTSVWNLFLPQVVQGIAFGLIFVSLSTASLMTVDRRDMTAATGLYNLVRIIFGSVGIAAAATLLNRYTVTARVGLVRNITAVSDTASSWLEGVKSSLVASGMDPVSAGTRALALLDAALNRQAAVMAYNRVFLDVALLFAACLPLVFLLRGGRPLEAGEKGIAGE